MLKAIIAELDHGTTDFLEDPVEALADITIIENRMAQLRDDCENKIDDNERLKEPTTTSRRI